MSATEAIWAGSLVGLRKGLKEADELAQMGDQIASRIKRASVWYSYRLVPGALGRAVHCVGQLRGIDTSRLSAEQCDVAGTIIFASGDADRARMYFDAGLQKECAPHQKALLYIGRAEVAATVAGADMLVRRFICQALDLYPHLRNEKDLVQAMRQFGRVLRRAAVLYVRLGNREYAEVLFVRARSIVTHKTFGSRSQRLKLRWARFKALS